MDDERLGIGGNNPPAVDPEKFAEAERLTREALTVAQQAIQLGPITDAGRASEVSDVVAAVRAAVKSVDAIRVDMKKPFDDAAAQVQKAFKSLLLALENDAEKLKGMMAEWLRAETARKEAERRQREAEARKAQEEAWAAKQLAEARGDSLAAAKADEAAKEAAELEAAAQKAVSAKAESATGGGRTMALRTQAYANIRVWRSVFIHFENEPEVREVLQRLADRAIRAGETVPGADRAERQTAA